ncbi:hypothetical protein ccbrp13_20060 [Ktedonobacteria bacterium brp13]|nr:hypothetical protein ccbrp13_20060 [Ktedonobacteria bacterium brp13]
MPTDIGLTAFGGRDVDADIDAGVSIQGTKMVLPTTSTTMIPARETTGCFLLGGCFKGTGSACED